MRVPLLDLRAQYASIRDEVRAADEDLIGEREGVFAEEGETLRWGNSARGRRFGQRRR